MPSLIPLGSYRKYYIHYLNVMRHLSARRDQKSRCLALILLFGVLGFLILKCPILFYTETLKSNFEYPMELDNFSAVVSAFKLGELDLNLLKPINYRYSKIPFIKTAIDERDLNSKLGLLIIVKSAISNYEKRATVRRTWGDASYLNDTALSPSLPSKLVFICGISSDPKDDKDTFLNELKSNDDIILADFVDTYSNNTYKSVLALRWAVEELKSNYEYLLLVDDDVFVDLFNIKFTLNGLPFRMALRDFDDASVPSFQYLRLSTVHNNSQTVPAIYNGQLYFGSVLGNSVPFRESFFNFGMGSKWIVAPEDFSFKLYPPYIPGAGMLLSKKTVTDFFYGSMFVEHYWIDDVFFGILAYKLSILPLHSPHFHSDYHGLSFMVKPKDIISDAMIIHGFKCPTQMEHFWRTRNTNLLSCDQTNT